VVVDSGSIEHDAGLNKCSNIDGKGCASIEVRGSIKISSADSLQCPVSGHLMLVDKSRPRIIFAAPNRAELADRTDIGFHGSLKNQRRGRGTVEDPSGLRGDETLYCQGFTQWKIYRVRSRRLWQGQKHVSETMVQHYSAFKAVCRPTSQLTQ
jgi:hypothetical protein